MQCGWHLSARNKFPKSEQLSCYLEQNHIYSIVAQQLSGLRLLWPRLLLGRLIIGFLTFGLIATSFARTLGFRIATPGRGYCRRRWQRGTRAQLHRIVSLLQSHRQLCSSPGIDSHFDRDLILRHHIAAQQQQQQQQQQLRNFQLSDMT